jgi:CrcB protein
MNTLLAVAVGGAAGSVLRHATQLWLRGAFPWGTLAVNLLGSLLIGLCAGWSERQGAAWVRPWLMTGFLGGFTTFSAFSLENGQLLREGRFLPALLYIVVSVGAGLALAVAGHALARA